jgi:chemotaxis protein methyltransferase WspC
MKNMDIDYIKLEKKLSEWLGLDAESIGRLSIVNALNRIIRNERLKSVPLLDVQPPDGVVHFEEVDFLELLETNKVLQTELIEEITVGETWFFRDFHAYEFLKKMITSDVRYLEGIRHSNNSTLRILSVPCSTGEEPYSIVISLMECGLKSEDFELDAVDINGSYLEKAMNGIYGKASFRGNYNFDIYKYFEIKNGNYIILDEIKNNVNFFKGNIIKPDFLIDKKKYDVIFNKNLLIYLNSTARSQVLENVGRLLSDEGLLFTGSTETMFYHHFGYKSVEEPFSFSMKKNLQIVNDNSSKISDTFNVSNINNKRVGKIPDTLKMSDFYEKRTEFGNKEKNKNFENDVIINKNAYNWHNSNSDLKSGQVLLSNGLLKLEKIRKIADSGDLDSAFSLSEEILKNKELRGSVEISECYYIQGEINLARNDWERAADCFTKSLYLEREHYGSLVYMSIIFEGNGEQERARLFKDRAARVFARKRNKG